MFIKQDKMRFPIDLKKIIPFLFVSFFSLTLSAQQEYTDQKIAWSKDTSTHVIMKNGRFGIISKGVEVIPVKYDIEQFYKQISFDGQAYFPDGAQFALGFGGKWGVMDNRGKIIIPFNYDHIAIQQTTDTKHIEYLGLDKAGKCAIADSTGKELTGYTYEAFYGYFKKESFEANNSKIAMKQGARVVFYDPSTKKTLNTLSEEEAGGAESVIVNYRGMKGVVSMTGEILLPCGYDEVKTPDGTEYENRSQPLIVRKKRSWGFWSAGTGFILQVNFQDIKADYYKGTLFFAVTSNNKVGLYDGTGVKITEFEFDSMEIGAKEIVGKKGKDKFSISPKGKISPMKK